MKRGTKFSIFHYHKNRGQGKIGIILGLVVMIFLIGVIAWAFRPIATGNVIVEDKADVKEGNFLGEPFELRAWVVSESGVQLDITNAGTEDYLVTDVEVKNCGHTDIGRDVRERESEIFMIPCPLVSGEIFDNIVIVNYQNTDRTITKSAFGNVRDLV